jgi:hypothetical protein
MRPNHPPLLRCAIAAGVMLAAATMTACSGTGNNSAIRELAGAGAPATPPPLPTETPDLAPPPTQIIEATRIVEVVITPTPDIAGFPSAPVIDESAQPCPILYWKRGRCIATQAQIEQAASEVQP